MHLVTRSDQSKLPAKLAYQFLDGVSFNCQAAACGWTIQRKRCDKQETGRTKSGCYMIDVLVAIGGISQEMENGTIVPKVIRARFEVVIQNIGLNP
jgi:hypothetical protein